MLHDHAPLLLGEPPSNRQSFYSVNEESRIVRKEPKRENLWELYIKQHRESDQKLARHTSDIVDTWLPFGGLVTIITAIFASSCLRSTPAYVRANVFSILALFIGLLSVFFGTLTKQWARQYRGVLASDVSPRSRAHIRYLWRTHAIRSFQLEFIRVIPVFTHVSIIAFAIAVVDSLFSTTFWVVSLVPSVAIMAFVGILLWSTRYFPNQLGADYISGSKKETASMRRKVGKRRVKWEDGVEYPPEFADERGDDATTEGQVDIEILCSLLRQAEADTGNWIIRACLEELQTLPPLSEHDASPLLNQAVVTDILGTLSKECIARTKETEELNEDHILLSRKLCDFLAWFLSLPRSSGTKSRLQHRVPSSMRKLVTLLSRRHHDSSDIVPAFHALGRLDHLFDPHEESSSCRLCRSNIQVLSDKLRDDRHRLLDQDTAVLLLITNSLICRTDCLILWDRRNGRWSREMLLGDVGVISDGLRARPGGVFEEVWEKILRENQKRASKELNEAWFEPLLDLMRKSLAGRDLGIRNTPVRIRVPSVLPSSINLPSDGEESPLDLAIGLRNNRDSFISDGSSVASYGTGSTAPRQWR